MTNESITMKIKLVGVEKTKQDLENIRQELSRIHLSLLRIIDELPEQVKVEQVDE